MSSPSYYLFVCFSALVLSLVEGHGSDLSVIKVLIFSSLFVPFLASAKTVLHYLCQLMHRNVIKVVLPLIPFFKQKDGFRLWPQACLERRHAGGVASLHRAQK